MTVVSSHVSGHIRLRLLGALVTTVACVGLCAPFAGAAPADDELNQTIDPNQSQGTGQVVLDQGHIDYGPTLNTGEWKLQIHDDTKSPSYWRNPEDVVLKVNDLAKLKVPDSPAYSFLGLEAGSDAWVVPQTRNPDVIWAGWNTQEPNVLNSLNLGVTQRILGVQGPGDVTVYLQSGNFGDPQMLWSSLQPFPQETWIEVNTHTHANWVFDKPGVYLVEVEFAGELVNGEAVSSTGTLRFAVGDQTDPQEAFVAQFDASDIQAQSQEQSAQAPASASAGSDTDDKPAATNSSGMVIGIVIGIVAAVLIIALVIVVVATRGAKKRALAKPVEASE